jgi:hypothetical protein
MAFGNSFGGGIGGSAIADGSVTTAKIADGAVTTDKYADDSITQDKLSSVLDGLLSKVVRLASQSLSGTQVNITGLPTGIKKIEIAISGLSTNGTSIPLLRLGDSGGVENTGYVGAVTFVSAAGQGASAHSTGFNIATSGNPATSIFTGTILLIHMGGNSWVEATNLSYEDTIASVQGAGSKTLSGELDRLQFTMANGTDAFDAGTIQVSYYYE